MSKPHILSWPPTSSIRGKSSALALPSYSDTGHVPPQHIFEPAFSTRKTPSVNSKCREKEKSTYFCSFGGLECPFPSRWVLYCSLIVLRDAYLYPQGAHIFSDRACHVVPRAHALGVTALICHADRKRSLCDKSAVSDPRK